MEKIKVKNSFERSIEELFKKESTNQIDLIWEIVSLVTYNNEHNKDILELYRLVNKDTFLKVIELYDGKTVEFPPVKKLKNNLSLALIYYYREIKNYSWDDIKKEFPFDINTISYGIQIKNLNNFIKQKIQEKFVEFQNIDKENHGNN